MVNQHTGNRLLPRSFHVVRSMLPLCEPFNGLLQALLIADYLLKMLLAQTYDIFGKELAFSLHTAQYQNGQ